MRLSVAPTYGPALVDRDRFAQAANRHRETQYYFVDTGLFMLFKPDFPRLLNPIYKVAISNFEMIGGVAHCYNGTLPGDDKRQLRYLGIAMDRVVKAAKHSGFELLGRRAMHRN
jgi:hypothetical protein